MNFHEFLDSEEFHDAVENKTPALFTIEEPDFDWNEIFKFLDEDVRSKKPYGKKMYAGLAFRLMFGQRIKLINEIMQHIYVYFDPCIDPQTEAVVYASLTTEEGNDMEKHMDIENVIFWQVHGKSQWIIYDENDNIIFDEVLEKNNLVYCPIGLFHHVIPVTPRLGFSLGFLER